MRDNRHICVALIFLVFNGLGVTLAVSDNQQFYHGANGSHNEIVNSLCIRLATDKAIYARGEEIHFTVTFFNGGAKSFQILIDDVFLGDQIVILDSAGHEISWCGGYIFFSPKVNYFTGTSHNISANGQFHIRLTAWIDNRFRLVFGERERNEPLDADTRNSLGVPEEYPDKYIGTGRIFDLKQPGRYQLVFHYERGERDRFWQLDSDPQRNKVLLRDLWTGNMNSNSVGIEVR